MKCKVHQGGMVCWRNNKRKTSVAGAELDGERGGSEAKRECWGCRLSRALWAAGRTLARPCGRRGLWEGVSEVEKGHAQTYAGSPW